MSASMGQHIQMFLCFRQPALALLADRQGPALEDIEHTYVMNSIADRRQPLRTVGNDSMR
jgi:hypothetical protein